VTSSEAIGLRRQLHDWQIHRAELIERLSFAEREITRLAERLAELEAK
jgi:hypothetical protein